jgi:hypothetical protein
MRRRNGSGEQLLNVTDIRLVHADAAHFVTADLVMLADEDGNPSAKPQTRDGEIILGAFRVNVSEMRVKQ